MYYLIIIATPKPELEDSENIEGAYVSCWINFQLQDGAELLAKHYIEEAGWIPGEIDTVKWIDEDHYKDDPEYLQYYMEADADGASFVFHQWSADDEDSNSDE